MSSKRVKLIIPTAINVTTMVNDAILTNLRRGTDATITLPNLRDRAKLIISESGVLPVVEQDEEPTVAVTR